MTTGTIRRVPTGSRIADRWQRLIDDPSPIVKQAPTLLAVLAAVVLMLTVPGLSFSSPVAAWVGVGAVMLASAAAVAAGRRTEENGWILLIPMVDILALGLFRAGTGGTSSLFSALVLLPVVWLAATPGRRYVVVVAVLTSVALLLPYVVDLPTQPVLWLRGVVTPLVFAAVAAIINELSRQQRRQIRRAERLVVQRTKTLRENEEIVARLSASEKQYRGLLDDYESLWNAITAQALIATDPEGRIVSWNQGARRLLGLTETEALGDRIERFLPARVLTRLLDEDRAPIAASPVLASGIRALFAAAEWGAEVDGDVDVLTATGAAFPARLTVSPRRDDSGALLGFLLVITDETRSAEIARMKDEFVGMISHELRTPLSAIIGFLDLLESDAEHPLSEDQLRFVGIIDRNAQRLLNLVGDLLFTAQVEAGRFPIERRDIDVNEVVLAAVASAGPLADREGITLEARVPSAPVPLHADPGRLGQAVDNLLSNALKFTPRGGTVTVAVERTDAGILLQVRDTGMGIPADEQQQLFTRFFRASTATRNAVPGVGLGLTITRAIVHAHGGEMSVSSEEGVGTEFRILLPENTAD